MRVTKATQYSISRRHCWMILSIKHRMNSQSSDLNSDGRYNYHVNYFCESVGVTRTPSISGVHLYVYFKVLKMRRPGETGIHCVGSVNKITYRLHLLRFFNGRVTIDFQEVCYLDLLYSFCSLLNDAFSVAETIKRRTEGW
jgi:hypothetical protein